MTGFQGQLQDFGAFYESTYPVAYRVAYGVVGERALAEDVTQVSELPYPDDDHAYRTEPVYQKLAGLMLHEALVGCSSITQHQLLRLAQDSGFSRVRVAAQSRPSRWVVVGERLLAEPSLNA